MLCEHIRQMPIPARSVPGAALSSLSLALLLSGNCCWDSSKRGSSQHCLVLFFVSPPVFPKLCSEHSRRWGAFFPWSFYSVGTEASGCHSRWLWVLILSKTFTLGMFHCSWMVKTAQLGNSQGKIGLKKKIQPCYIKLKPSWLKLNLKMCSPKKISLDCFRLWLFN